jgi:TatD DNase family protein
MMDFHCHLDLYKHPTEIVSECESRGMDVLSVTTTPSAWLGTLAVSSSHNQIKTALGLHPQLAHQRKTELPLFDKYLPQTRFVGEIGLDGSPEFQQFLDDQLLVFKHILGACSKQGGKILSIHSKRASSAVLDCIELFPLAGTAILHWFTGSKSDLKRAINLGCWFSINPSMLLSKTSQLLIKEMPSNRILTETDGPFAQINGKSALPWDANLAVEGLTKIWSMQKDEVDSLLNANLSHLIGDFS